jgi:hypothetical protein
VSGGASATASFIDKTVFGTVWKRLRRSPRVNAFRLAPANAAWNLTRGRATIHAETTHMTKASLIAASAVGISLLASVAQVQAQGRPSWCNSQGSLNAAERTVCATRSLWDLDYQLTLIYQSALNSVGSQRARLRRTQEDWVRVTRNGCNDDDTCLADVYERRISIVRSIDNRGSIEPNGLH